MLKTLIKKQFQSFFASLMRGKRGSKSKGKGTLILFAVLMIYLVAFFGWIIYSMMSELCMPLNLLGLDWLYFTYASIMATVLAVIGSVFMAQSQLFEAKDNELMTSLPIPPKYILLCRIIPLYFQNLFFEALVLIPAFAVFYVNVGAEALHIVCWLFLLFLMPLLSLGLTCILGWLTALISSRTRNKNIFTIVFSLVFFAVYFYLYSQIGNILQNIISVSYDISGKIKVYLYLFYQMGTAGTGNIVSLLIVALIILVFFTAVYAVLSRSYIRITTSKRGAAKRKYREKVLKVSSAERALLRKERMCFTGNAIYMLNCGLGTLLLIAGAVFGIIYNEVLSELNLFMPDIVPPAICLMICFICSMNCVSAPSVSLEGKNLWIIQSLPVSGWQILKGKLFLHFLVTAPAAFICSVVFIILLNTTPIMTVFMLVIPQIFLFFCGEIGLCINLKKPDFGWDSVAIAVKHSMSVVLSLLIGMGIPSIFCVVYIFVASVLSIEVYILICLAFILALGALFFIWLKKRGAEIIEFL